MSPRQDRRPLPLQTLPPNLVRRQDERIHRNLVLIFLRSWVVVRVDGNREFRVDLISFRVDPYPAALQEMLSKMENFLVRKQKKELGEE